MSTGGDLPQTRTEVWAELTIRGDGLSLEAISADLGIDPTKTWSRGTPAFKGGGSAVWKDDGWRWGTQHEFSRDLPRLIEDVVDLFAPKTEVVKRIAQSGSSVYLEGVAEIHDGDVPLIVLSNSVLTTIAQMGASLAFDLIMRA